MYFSRWTGKIALALLGGATVCGFGTLVESHGQDAKTTTSPPGAPSKEAVRSGGESDSVDADDPPNPASERIRVAVNRELKLATEVYEELLHQIKGAVQLPGVNVNINLESVDVWSQRMLDAESKLAETRETKVEAAAKHRDRMREVAGLARARAKAGEGRESDAKAAEYFLAAAEHRLLEVESQPAVTSMPGMMRMMGPMGKGAGMGGMMGKGAGMGGMMGKGAGMGGMMGKGSGMGGMMGPMGKGAGMGGMMGKGAGMGGMMGAMGKASGMGGAPEFSNEAEAAQAPSIDERIKSMQQRLYFDPELLAEIRDRTRRTMLATLNAENERHIRAEKGDSKSKAALDILDKHIPLSFAKPTPFKEVIDYLKTASKSAKGPGLSIYVDETAMSEDENGWDSEVIIDLGDVPLKASLRLMLRQLHLASCVRDGVLIISTPEEITTELSEIKEVESIEAGEGED